MGVTKHRKSVLFSFSTLQLNGLGVKEEFTLRKNAAELDYALHTLMYRCSLYARNRHLARKYRLLMEQYGAALKYSQEDINRQIQAEQRHVLAVRRRREKAGMKYPIKPA
jgi:hypothetical protein